MANSTLLQIPLLSTSQSAKEQTINTMVSYLERAMNDTITVPLAGGDYTITPTDLARYMYWKFTGAGAGSDITITPAKRMFVVDNLSNGVAITVKSGAASLNIPANAVVIVMATVTPTLVSVADSSVMGGGGGATSFTALTDAFPSYTSRADHILRVKNDLTGLESVELTTALLTDVDAASITDGQVLVWNATDSKFEPGDMVGGGVGVADVAATMVNLVATANVDIGGFTPGDAIDGVATNEDDRVLLTNQTAPLENGIYRVTATTIVRSADMDSLDEPLQGLTIYSLSGDAYGDTFWVLVSDMNSVGSSVLEFNQPRAGTFSSLNDFDSGVVATDNMVLVYNATTEKWTPTVTSTSLPSGGTTNQVLMKNSGTSYDFSFKTVIPDGGTTGQMLVKSSNDDLDTEWVDQPTGSAGTTLRTFTGTTDTAVLGDAGNLIGGNNAGAITATIPTNASVAYPIGTTLTWLNLGAGLITVAPAGGVTLHNTPGLTLTAYAQWSLIAAVKVGTDEWVASGNYGEAP